MVGVAVCGRNWKSHLGEPIQWANSAGQHAGTATATLGTKAGAAFGFTRLFVVFAAAHFFLDAASFDQFSETTNGFLNRFAITNY